MSKIQFFSNKNKSLNKYRSAIEYQTKDDSILQLEKLPQQSTSYMSSLENTKSYKLSMYFKHFFITIFK